MIPIPGGRYLAAVQRVAIVLILLLPFLIVTLACVPALLFLPFSQAGSDRAVQLVGRLVAWTRVLLSGIKPLT
ncbi:dTMP kinase [Streptomyces chartreusis]|uniref:dTMP kinase n=1 Tax=Streptomyces chartreusis TaxID=1969 RepID=UPI0036C030EF